MAEANSKTESMIFLMISPSRLVSILGARAGSRMEKAREWIWEGQQKTFNMESLLLHVVSLSDRNEN